MTGYITKDEALAEKIICSTCEDDKQREYVHCNKCTRCSDFLKGLAEGRKEKCLEQNKDGTIRPCEVMRDNEELLEKIEKENKISEEIIIGEQQEINRHEKQNKALGKRVLQLQADKGKLIDENRELKAQVEKMKSFIHSEIDFCIYCPLTNECRNEEGTCPYAYATEEEQKNLLMDFIKNWELAE